MTPGLGRLAALGLLIAALGCVQSPTGPAFVYMNVKGPLGPADGKATPKTGRSCADVYFGLFAHGDASIETAKRKAGITTVSTVDHHSTNLLGFGSFCTVVHGE